MTTLYFPGEKSSILSSSSGYFRIYTTFLQAVSLTWHNLLRHVVVLSFKKMSSNASICLRTKVQSLFPWTLSTLLQQEKKEIIPSSPTRALISVLLTLFKHFNLHVSFGYEPALRFAETISHYEHKHPFDRTGPCHVSKTDHIIYTSW